MPVFDFRCEDCASVVKDVLIRNEADQADNRCPKCRSSRLVRLYTGHVGLRFTGSGFYETDYKTTPLMDKRGEINLEPMLESGLIKEPSGDSPKEASVPAETGGRTVGTHGDSPA